MNNKRFVKNFWDDLYNNNLWSTLEFVIYITLAILFGKYLETKYLIFLILSLITIAMIKSIIESIIKTKNDNKK